MIYLDKGCSIIIVESIRRLLRTVAVFVSISSTYDNNAWYIYLLVIQLDSNISGHNVTNRYTGLMVMVSSTSMLQFVYVEISMISVDYHQ